MPPASFSPPPVFAPPAAPVAALSFPASPPVAPGVVPAAGVPAAGLSDFTFDFYNFYFIISSFSTSLINIYSITPTILSFNVCFGEIIIPGGKVFTKSPTL